MPTSRPRSGPWSVLAAVGKIESNHGRFGGGELQPDGRIDPPIIGIALDGTRGTARILDTDGGRLDGDAVFDRTVGPMQFIPSTWRGYGIDASRDGVADPHNAIDATWSAARYLCALGADDPSRVADAIWSYNHSWEYVDEVMAQASAYATAAVGIQPASPTLIAMVLANARLDIYEAGRQDIAAGRIDARVLQVLQLAKPDVHAEDLESPDRPLPLRRRHRRRRVPGLPPLARSRGRHQRRRRQASQPRQRGSHGAGRVAWRLMNPPVVMPQMPPCGPEWLLSATSAKGTGARGAQGRSRPPTAYTEAQSLKRPGFHRPVSTNPGAVQLTARGRHGDATKVGARIVDAYLRATRDVR